MSNERNALDSISATDWLETALPYEPSWTSDDTGKFAAILAEHGVDLIDISTSGNSPAQIILKSGPGYQVPFSAEVKAALGDKLLVSAVGGINDGKLAQSILNEICPCCFRTLMQSTTDW